MRNGVALVNGWRDVFTVEEVGDFFNANFVNLKMDMETEEGRMLNKTYQVAVYPTLFVLDADGEIILREKGYRDARGLLQVGRKALLPSESEMLDMADQFQSGQYDVLFFSGLPSGIAMDREGRAVQCNG